jgi:anti-anti-sigma factor
MYDKTSIETEEHPDGLRIVHVRGDLDSMGSRMVAPVVDAALTDCTGNVVVNLGKVSFISSAGMALILKQGKRLRLTGGKLVIAGSSPRVFEVLSMAGFHELFEFYPTVTEAVAALQA